MVGQTFDQDVDICDADTAEAFRAAASRLDPSERAEVAAMLDRALATMTPSEMQGVWNRARSDVTFDKADIRALFAKARAAMAPATPPPSA